MSDHLYIGTIDINKIPTDLLVNFHKKEKENFIISVLSVKVWEKVVLEKVQGMIRHIECGYKLRLKLIGNIDGHDNPIKITIKEQQSPTWITEKWKVDSIS